MPLGGQSASWLVLFVVVTVVNFPQTTVATAHSNSTTLSNSATLSNRQPETTTVKSATRIPSATVSLSQTTTWSATVSLRVSLSQRLSLSLSPAVSATPTNWTSFSHLATSTTTLSVTRRSHSPTHTFYNRSHTDSRSVVRSLSATSRPTPTIRTSVTATTTPSVTLTVTLRPLSVSNSPTLSLETPSKTHVSSKTARPTSSFLVLATRTYSTRSPIFSQSHPLPISITAATVASHSHHTTLSRSVSLQPAASPSNRIASQSRTLIRQSLSVTSKTLSHSGTPRHNSISSRQAFSSKQVGFVVLFAFIGVFFLSIVTAILVTTCVLRRQLWNAQKRFLGVDSPCVNVNVKARPFHNPMAPPHVTTAAPCEPSPSEGGMCRPSEEAEVIAEVPAESHPYPNPFILEVEAPMPSAGTDSILPETGTPRNHKVRPQEAEQPTPSAEPNRSRRRKVVVVVSPSIQKRPFPQRNNILRDTNQLPEGYGIAPHAPIADTVNSPLQSPQNARDCILTIPTSVQHNITGHMERENSAIPF